ncbi:MAG TPA: glutathione binding-like protein [Stellaceae bacterium]|nr:glutathione binding-like protein [Stellaceae bacterium]
MIELYYWPTPNGHKITIFCEEAGIPYTIKPVNIQAGEQFKPDFLKISPNNRMPAIVDTEPADKGAPLSVFESGAILVYLAEKTGKFLPKDLRGRVKVLEWLAWQVGGLGPMAGQVNHFVHYAPEKIPYAMDRYVKEVSRLYAVMDKQLAGSEYLAGAFSIADMAAYPWTMIWERQQQKIEEFPNVKRWLDAMANRAGVKAAIEKGKAYQSNRQNTDPEVAKILFGQSAATLRGR